MNSQNVKNEICPHESVEHHRQHRRWNREINQFCLGLISKYWEIWYRCIAGHYPAWAGSLSWVRRHHSLHFSIKGDGLRAYLCFIFKYRVWPENSLLWKSLITSYKNIVRVNYKKESLIGIYYVVQHKDIAISKSALRRFGSAFF